MALEIAALSGDTDEFTERFYRSPLIDWTWEHGGWTTKTMASGSSTEIVPAVVGILHLCDSDVEQAVIAGVNFGRDNDTIVKSSFWKQIVIPKEPS